MTTISVVMATYNGRRFLDAQLQSLLDQTRQPDELVVCDDQSSDETVEMVTAFAARAPFPVRINRNETRKGYRENFMAAASLAACDLIAFCDQDDVWRADKLEKVVAAFEQGPALLVHHNAKLVDTDGQFMRLFRPRGQFPGSSEALSIDPWFFPYGLCQTIRRELLEYSHLRTLAPDFYFDGEVFAHDQWFFFLASSLGRVAYIDEDLVDYRQHGGNTYGLSKPKGLRARLSIMRQVGWSTFKRRSDSTTGRLAVLRQVQSMSPQASAMRSASDLAIQRYDWFAEVCALRAEAYGGQSFWRRAASWLRLIARGGYETRRPWSFGPRSMLRDGALGVLLGRGSAETPVAEHAIA